jgi:hypothetical protein
VVTVPFDGDEDGNQEVFLKGYEMPGEGNPRQVVCKVAPASKEKAAEITKGQKVRFRGKCALFVPVFAVRIEDAELIETGPDPAVPIAARQLSEEFAKDKEAAEKQYSHKQLLIDGVVVEVKQKGIAWLVVLEGFNEKAEKPLRVKGKVCFGLGNVVKNFQIGQKAKIKGGISRVDEEVVYLAEVTIVK